MLKTFVASGQPVGLLLEDDVLFQALEHLQEALSELPEDWDVLYLGANITEGVTGIRERPPVRHSKHLWRVGAAWTSHCIAYTRNAAQKVISAYDGISMYDAWLSDTILPISKAFIISPMVAFQRPGFSDLWGGVDTDYLGVFELGNNILNH